jgi:spore germination protein GerM
VNVASILPVYRIFPASKNILIDTISELLAWKLTPNERRQWFISEFPNNKFTLLSTNLSSDGTLTLEFSQVPWFTDGWSARMLILSNVIEKTALQFSGVKKVVFIPETLFQP